MSRGLLFSAACLLAAGAVTVPLALRAEEPKEPKIVTSASTTEPYLIRLKKADSGVVIRNAEELVGHTDKPESAKDATVPCVLRCVAA